MKESNYFFAFLFICTGIALLLNSLDMFEYDLSLFTDYWAVSLILIGISVIVNNSFAKKVLYSTLGIFVSLVLLSFYQELIFKL